VLFNNPAHRVINHFFSPNPIESGAIRPTWQSTWNSSAFWGKVDATATFATDPDWHRPPVATRRPTSGRRRLCLTKLITCSIEISARHPPCPNAIESGARTTPSFAPFFLARTRASFTFTIEQPGWSDPLLKPDGHYCRPASQCITTVIGAEFSSSALRLTRKRCPSRVTTY